MRRIIVFKVLNILYFLHADSVCNLFFVSNLNLYRVAGKNATPTINDFKKTRDRIKKSRALLRIKFFSHQDDTKIINFDEGVLILWPFFRGNVIFKFCHFCLKSHNWRTANVHGLASRVKCLLLLWKTKAAWIKRTIHYVILQCYNPGEATQRNSSLYLNGDFWYKRSTFWKWHCLRKLAL